MNKTPLAVDLDGTLVNTDTLTESVLMLVKNRPLVIFILPFWLLKGKAYMKRRLSNLVSPDPALLPYNPELVSWLRDQHDSGRELVLCTAADQKIADGVASHLGLFSLTLASDGLRNMKGANKRETLEELFSNRGFSYAGDTGTDLAIWQAASTSVIVSNSLGLKTSAQKLCPTEKEFSKPKIGLSDIAKLLRVHQWSKNLLLLVPAVAAHQIAQIDLILTLALAFFSFSLCSSAVYIANDLIDLENDRRHPRKCARPFASGLVPVASGLVLFPLLLTVSAAIALQVGSGFAWALLSYFLLTCAYSAFIKEMVLLDCLALAGTYTLRVIAGAAAISMGVSFWILSFSLFLFLSLAYLKRFAELQEVADQNQTTSLHGRSYYHGDSQFVQILGITAGFISVLVLALYIDSTASAQLYRKPEIVWGAVVVMLYWVSWVWLKAHRGEMHDDPVVFAITDRVSLWCGLLFAVIIALGTVGVKP
jgi:4-hydroxybenzoate polyprenyltransferase/phosphoserine phosphatase